MRNSAIGARGCQTRRQKVCQRNVGGLSRTIVGDFDLESHRVAFGRCTVAAGQRFNRDQIRVIIDNNGLTKVVTGGAWIRLIRHRRSCDISDRVAALAYINGTSQCQRRGFACAQCSDIKQTRPRVVSSLGDSPVGAVGCQTRWQEIGQRNVRRLSAAIVGDNDLEDHRVAFGRCTIATGKCFNGHQIRVVIDNDLFF